MVQYNEFMKWFRQRDPIMYSKYWQRVKLPTEMGGMMDWEEVGIDEGDLVLLRDLAEEYAGREARN